MSADDEIGALYLPVEFLAAECAGPEPKRQTLALSHLQFPQGTLTLDIEFTPAATPETVDYDPPAVDADDFFNKVLQNVGSGYGVSCNDRFHNSGAHCVVTP